MTWLTVFFENTGLFHPHNNSACEQAPPEGRFDCVPRFVYREDRPVKIVSNINLFARPLLLDLDRDGEIYMDTMGEWLMQDRDGDLR